MLNIYFKYEGPMYENSGIRRYMGGEGVYPNFMKKPLHYSRLGG